MPSSLSFQLTFFLDISKLVANLNYSDLCAAVGSAVSKCQGVDEYVNELVGKCGYRATRPVELSLFIFTSGIRRLTAY